MKLTRNEEKDLLSAIKVLLQTGIKEIVAGKGTRFQLQKPFEDNEKYVIVMSIRK